MKKLCVFLLSLTLLSQAALAAENKTAPASANKTTVAASILLYEQPEANAKVIGTIPAGQAIVPIFSQGDWTKIGDPQNGNVGWVNQKTLSAQGFPKIYINTFGVKNGAKQSQGVQVIQYSGTPIVDEKQVQTLLTNLQQQQAQMQRTFNQLFNQGMEQFNQMAKQIQVQFNESQAVEPADKNVVKTDKKY